MSMNGVEEKIVIERLEINSKLENARLYVAEELGWPSLLQSYLEVLQDKLREMFLDVA